MIVLAADMSKRSHTVAAVAAATAELLDDRTAPVGEMGFRDLLEWGRGLGEERVWALEDCRHVSGSFERFLIEHGERVVRVPTKLMAGARRASRERGKSDRIDALAVARAAVAEGVETLPTAELAGPELDLRLLVDHRERLIRSRVALNSTVLWHLHDLWPELEISGSGLFYAKWHTRIARRLARAEQSARVRIARDELRHLHELTGVDRRARARDHATGRRARAAPAHRAGVRAADRRQAARRGRRHPAVRHRRQARPRRRRRADPDQLRQDQTTTPRPRRQPPAQRHPAPDRRHARPLPPRDHACVARKRAEGKTTREAIRCLKRHLARQVWHLLQEAPPDRERINLLMP
jgi:transposase